MYDRFETRYVLIIAPLRVAQSVWKQEVQKWEHLTNISVSVACGTESERIAAIAQKADITVINRENVEWLVSTQKFYWDMVVIDELSSFKSHSSKRFKALLKVRPQVDRIVGLTGTPTSNGLMDLFAEFRVLDMGERLGRFITGYRDKYFTPDKRNGSIVFSYKPRPNAEEQIYEKIGDITVSMKAIDYLDMPELIFVEHSVELSAKEKAIYTKLKSELAIDIGKGEITALNAAALTNKLTQLSNGFMYADEGKAVRIHERKLDELENITEQMNGQPLLVFYWFKEDYAMITERLAKLKINFANLAEKGNIEKWNNKEIAVGLAHPASLGHGINLQQGGNEMCWFGETWSLELREQAIARLYRQGQKNGTVVVHDIITEGTMDKRILQSIKAKTITEENLMEALKAELFC